MLSSHLRLLAPRGFAGMLFICLFFVLSLDTLLGGMVSAPNAPDSQAHANNRISWHSWYRCFLLAHALHVIQLDLHGLVCLLSISVITGRVYLWCRSKFVSVDLFGHSLT